MATPRTHLILLFFISFILIATYSRLCVTGNQYVPIYVIQFKTCKKHKRFAMLESMNIMEILWFGPNQRGILILLNCFIILPIMSLHQSINSV